MPMKKPRSDCARRGFFMSAFHVDMCANNKALADLGSVVPIPITPLVSLA